MDVVKASTMWAGPRNDLLQVFIEPTPEPWGVTWDDLPDDIDDELVVFRELDANEEPTGPVAGIEILDFLTFDRWDAVPRFPMLWQVPGWEPLPLVDLLKRLQPELRERTRLADAAAHSQAVE